MPNGTHLETRYMKAYRNSMKFKFQDRFSYDNYWKPIKDKVGEFSTIYLSADGVFNQINLETIPTGDGKYVLDNSNIIMVSNTKDIYFKRIKKEPEPKENKATMFGDPIFYASTSGPKVWSPLPGTKAEITALNEILIDNGWNADSYLEESATEENLKNTTNPKILHVATHGFFTADDAFEANEDVGMEEARASQNPLLRTGLLLSGAGDLLNKTSFNYNIDGGILTAYEAMNMNLDYTELVVLSACETGLGDVISGEGVYGLQRAFLVAGADALIMSLFKVSDEATQKLMVKFYEKWTQSGEMRESFIEAKKELRNEFKDPIFWGAFVMIGME
jgi:CHAT domain-containing protein